MVFKSRGSTVVRALFKAISRTPVTLARNLTVIGLGYAPEGAKRRYEAHFISKLTDCDGENAETDSSLDFAKDSGYIASNEHAKMAALCAEIGKMLGAMMKNPTPFLITSIDAGARK